MKQIHKQYDKPFLLESTKLIRLVETIHERMAGQQHRDHFEVFLAGNRHEEMTNIDDVLALDNSPKHKIQRLLVLCSASMDSAGHTEHEVQVDFGVPKDTTVASGNTKNATVAIRVRSDKSGWASRTLSEVEEQVERAWLRYNPPVLAMIGILLASAFLLSSQVDIARAKGEVPVRTMWLQRSDLDHLEAFVREPRVITDQELKELVTRQLRNVLEAERPLPSTRKGNRQQLLLMIPVGAVLTCILMLMFTCYPKAVFLWGDEVDRYRTLLERRKVLWGVITAILFVGLVSRLFSEAVIPWLPQE